MKNLKILVSTVLILLLMNNCSDAWLDVNDDPNSAPTATVELLLPSGVVSAGAMMGDWYNLVGGFWSQHWTQSNAANQYKGIDQYQMDASTMNSSWTEMYVGALSDLQEVLNKAEETNNNAYILMGTVMQACAYQFMVDYYNNIPFDAALVGDQGEAQLHPTYSNGQDVYDSLIVRIDRALAMDMNELTDAQENADLMFGGDLDLWVQFANTLKLKIYMRQMYARPAIAQAGIEKLYADGAEFLSSDAGLDIFEDKENKDNPLYASNVRKLNVGSNLRVSATFYKYLKTQEDPRIASYVADLSKTNALPQGGFNIASTVIDPTTVPVFKQSATTPVYFISEVESYLLQAEAIAKGWGTGDDKAFFDDAVTADFTRKGLDTDTLTTMLGAGGVYAYPAAGTFDEKQEAIVRAKWVAFAGTQSAESFFETNRTHYPVRNVNTAISWTANAVPLAFTGDELILSLEAVTNGKFPNRLNYPQVEMDLNKNAPAQVAVTEKVWWDKK